MIKKRFKEMYLNDSQMRIWLPEQLRLEMNVVVCSLEQSLSSYLREFFVIYLYGVHALVEMKQNKTGIFYKPPQVEKTNSEFDTPSFSRARSVEFIPGLGKNIVPFKMFLNSQIKSDLQLLADKSEMALSQFVREILVSHFLGHTFWPERNQSFNLGQLQTANQWESGDLEANLVLDPCAKEEASLEGKIENLHL